MQDALLPAAEAPIDFSLLQNDLAELQQDEKVRHVLEAGVNLRSYQNDVAKELETLVKDSIPDYVKEAPETQALHEDIASCDLVLNSIEEILHEFQRDLGGISDEIRHLQQNSLSMGVKLQNRKAVELRLRLFLERVTVPPDLTHAIVDGEVDVEFVSTLRRLDAHIEFLKEKEPGVVLVAGREAGTSNGNNNNNNNAHDDGGGESQPVTLPLAPSQAKALQDVEPQVEKLRLRATAKVRAFLLDRISSLKKPNTNVQILQQDLLRFRFFVGFVGRHAPPVAEEVRAVYMDSMRGVLYSLFKVYHAQLVKLLAPAVAAGGNPKEDVLASPVRRPDLLLPAVREAEMGAPGSPPLVVHVAQSLKGKLNYETMFRSEQKHLIDSASSEYLFLLEFFGASSGTSQRVPASAKQAKQVASSLFDQIFGKTLQLMLESLDAFLATASDPVTLLLMIKITQDHHETVRRRRVPVLEQYYDQLNNRLWPALKRIIDANIKSLATADPRKLMGVKPEPQAHFVTRRYALLAASIHAVSMGLSENSDGSIPRALDILNARCVDLLHAMGTSFTSPKLQAVFMINNCDAALAAFSEVGVVQPTDVAKFDELLTLNSHTFIEEELKECFGRLLAFVKTGEADANKIDDNEAKQIIADFSSNWRSGMEQINAAVATYFASFTNARTVLSDALTQVVMYWTRFRTLISERPAFKGKQIRSVELPTLYAEIQRFAKSWN